VSFWYLGINGEISGEPVELVEDYFGSGFRGGVGSVLHFADFFVFLVGIFEDVLNVVNWILEFYLFGFQTQVLLFLKKE
jgi:hypothetical protein